MVLKLQYLACQCLIVLAIVTSSWCQKLKRGSGKDDSFGLPILGSVGQPCESKEDCDEFSEECDPALQVCQCKSNFVVIPEDRKCLPICNQIYDECEHTLQCVYGSLGHLSVCLDESAGTGSKVCYCTDRAVGDSYTDPNVHVCRPIVERLGDPCVINDQCNTIPQGDQCVMSVCDCRYGTVGHPDRTRCLDIRYYLGDICEFNEQCGMEHSECRDFGAGFSTCTCAPGTVPSPNLDRCIIIAEHVGDPCQTDIECQEGLGELSACTPAAVCQCLDVAVPSSDNRQCLPLQHQLGGPCEEDVQCRYGIPGENSVCNLAIENWQGICTCQSDSVAFENRCFRLAEYLGDSCEIDLQCQTNLGNVTICKENICQCNTSTSSQNITECLALVHEIGGVCEVDPQCTQGTPGELSICKQDGNSKTCQCLEEAINDIGEHVCRRKALSVGDSCLRNAQCKANLGNLSECLVGETCVCTPFYGVPSFIGDKCLPVVNFIGGECLERQQCTAGIPGEYSDCIDSPIIPDAKICNCSDGAENEPGRHECRIPKVFIGNPCQNDEQCVGEPGISSGCGALGICGCLGGFVSNRDKNDCLPIRNQLGDSCLEHEQCQAGIPGPLSNCCNTCNCTEYAVNEPGQHYCHRKALLVGDACRVNIQCEANLGEYSHCFSGQCECKNGAEAAADLSTCLFNLFQ